MKPDLPGAEPDYDLIAAAIVDMLGDRAMDEDEIAADLDEQALGLAEDEDAYDYVYDVLEEHAGTRFVLTADGRWAGARTVLTDRWLTHAVTEAEIAADLLRVDADLLPIAQLLPGRAADPVRGGGSLRHAMLPWEESLADRDVADGVIPIGGAIVLPSGTLAGLGAGPGSIIALCRHEDAWELTLPGDDGLAEAGSLLEVISTVFDNEDVAPPIGADQLVSTICLNDAGVLREPVVPLTEALAQGGLQLLGELVAPSDFDAAEWQRTGLVKRLGHTYQLGFEEGEAVADLISLVEALETVPDESRFDHVENPDLADSDAVGAAIALASQGPANLIDALAPWLRSETVVEVLFAELVGPGDDYSAGLLLFAAAAVERAPRSARPGLLWLQGRVMESWGEPLRARASYQAALAVDGSWVPALIRLAGIESDRGQAQAGLRLLQQAGDRADESLVEFLTQQIPKVRTDVPRNAKCPCGSGRKFKQCHMRQAQAPLADRAQWLYRKALGFLLENYGAVLTDFARFRNPQLGSDDDLVAALGDGLIVDVALSEGQAFEDFLVMRGELLPPDERAMADMWALTERSVYEVESARPGRSLTLRDVRSGDVVKVPERSASRQLKKGQLICTRLLPVADSWLVFGGVEPVGLHERTEIMELLDSGPAPEELISRFSARFAPPTMRTMEGEEVVLCSATIAVTDPQAVVRVFDETYHREDVPEEDGPDGHDGSAGRVEPTGNAESESQRRWLELVEVHGADRIRATLTLMGDSLDISCNSVERFDRVLAFVAEVDPGREIVSESREPIDWAKLADQEPTEESRQEHARVQEEALADPEFVAALTDLMRKHETAWLDESIPALAGLTPREAAADPTRREDLIRLLDSFPKADGDSLVMDPDRLRAALSL